MSKLIRMMGQVVSRSYVNIYLAGQYGYMWYPYWLQPAKMNKGWCRDSCTEYMVDSGFKNEKITNMDVLDAAESWSANWVIPKDYPAIEDTPPEEAQRRTTESVREFLDLYEDHDCWSRVLIPLQPPYLEHYKDFEDRNFFALGGMAFNKPKDQIWEIQKFREEIGYDKYVHVFGMGMSLHAIKAIRDDPMLIDSMDLSSPIQRVIHNEITDKYHNAVEVAYPKGEYSTVIRSFAVMFMLLQLNYVLGPWCDDDQLDEALASLAYSKNLLEFDGLGR